MKVVDAGRTYIFLATAKENEGTKPGSGFIQKLVSAIIVCLLLIPLSTTNSLANRTAPKSETQIKKEATRAFNSANQQLKIGDYKAAIKGYKEMIAIQPDWRAYFQMANCFKHLEKPKKAAKCFKLSLQEDNTVSRIYNNRGNLYLEMGKYNQAIKDYNQAVRMDPMNSWAYNNRGAARIFHQDVAEPHPRDVERAIKDFARSIQLRSFASDTAYFNRGYSFNLQGEYEKAIHDLDVAIKLNNQNVRAFLQRALAFYKLGDIVSAEVDVLAAIDLGKSVDELKAFTAQESFSFETPLEPSYEAGKERTAVTASGQ